MQHQGTCSGLGHPVCEGSDGVCSCPTNSTKRFWRGRLTPHSIAHANTVIMPKKSEVSGRPAEDLASLLPDFEIADMHNSLSSAAKTLLHTLARISFYNFPSFKEKSPHKGDSGRLSAFPPKVWGCHGSRPVPRLLPYLLVSWTRRVHATEEHHHADDASISVGEAFWERSTSQSPESNMEKQS